jgi:hypothetical protein
MFAAMRRMNSQLISSAKIPRGVAASGQRIRSCRVALAMSVSRSSCANVSSSNAGSNFSVWGIFG